jgi:hypothetical protein
MTRKKGQRFFPAAMIQLDIAMGYFSSLRNPDRFVITEIDNNQLCRISNRLNLLLFST